MPYGSSPRTSGLSLFQRRLGLCSGALARNRGPGQTSIPSHPFHNQQAGYRSSDHSRKELYDGDFQTQTLLIQWYVGVGLLRAFGADDSSTRGPLETVRLENLSPTGGTDNQALAHSP